MELGTRLVRLGEAAAALIEDGQTVGLGTGSTANAMIEALGRRVTEGLCITGVVTSRQTKDLASQVGIPLRSIDEVETIDIGIDGADEIDSNLTLIKGRGGALLYEKIVAERCRRFVVIAATEKLVDCLGLRLPLPVEIIPFGCTHTARAVASLGLSPTLRHTGSGEPYTSDGGHYVLDCAPHHITDPIALAGRIKAITGVVEHGLFCGLVTEAMVVDEEGAVRRVLQ
jgi:ribose 5-phosphate isomerase A